MPALAPVIAMTWSSISMVASSLLTLTCSAGGVSQVLPVTEYTIIERSWKTSLRTGVIPSRLATRIDRSLSGSISDVRYAISKSRNAQSAQARAASVA